MRNVVWCLPGMAFFGDLVSKVLGWPLIVGAPVGDVDKVFIVGYYDPPYYGTTLAATQRAKERIGFFCGTDVALLKNSDLLHSAKFLCDSPDLQRELMEKGIEASVCTLPTPNHFPVTPLPEKPTVSVYLGSDPDKYGVNTVFALMEVLKDVEFNTYMFGTHDPEEMRKLCEDTSVYLRLTYHDGGCASAREYMEAGRRAVITADFPHAIQVPYDNLNTIIGKLKQALAIKEPDLEASAYYRKFNSNIRFLQDLEKAGVFHG